MSPDAGPSSLLFRPAERNAVSGDIPAAESRRIEAKYSFPGADLESLRQLLYGTCRRVSFNHSVSTVRSIYFDDHRLTACRGNLDGLATRNKVRLRWYDNVMPDGQAYFEVKWRENRVTGKYRVLMDLSQPLESIPYRDMPDALTEALPPELRPFALRYSQPIVLVEYHREHFVCADPRFRLTLDYDLKFYDQAGTTVPRCRFGFEEFGATLIEAKGPVGEESQLSNFFKPLSIRPSRSSKYIRGCVAIGLVGSLG